MESQAITFGASGTISTALSDLNPHATASEHACDSMELDFPEQLLTPENSRSETSSNTENALNDEKAAPRRRSTRVTRASLQRATQPGHSETDNENEDASSLTCGNYNVADETSVGVVRGRRSRLPLLRHSLAVMESCQWSDSAPIRDDTTIEDPPRVPDTPISNSSQEPDAEDVNTSMQQRSLRKRARPALIKKENQVEKKSPARKSVKPGPVRRSSRLSLAGRTTSLFEHAISVLGKRSRNVMERGKEVGRRASLRPRNITKPKEEPAAVVPVKKRRFSDSDIPNSKDTESTSEVTKPVTRYKPKRWLPSGLYIGQEPSDSPPRQNRGRTTKRRRPANQQRRFLPMPMFAGARLLANGRDFKLPFDIFSPLPLRQPKPDEWRKTNKNVFVGEAGSIWRANKPLELSKCLCVKETGCDENCQNRYMFYECDDSNCGVGSECGNRNFEELKHRTKAGGKYNIGVEVIKTQDRGYGVRSNRTFEPNQIIVEYTGEIITQTECERRMRTIYKNNKCYYLMYFDQNMIIDATRGSIARFVNHSCQPNCRMEKWTVAGKPRMALFAGDRGIMTGEELSYDYNFDPYSQKNVQECRCGSENCRGVLGPRPKEQRVKDSSPKRMTARTARAKAGTKRKSTADDPPSRRRKRRRVLTPRSIKTGIKSVATKARSAISRRTTTRRRGVARRSTAKEETTSPRTVRAKRGPKRGPKAKDDTGKRATKLPVVKRRAKATATVRANNSPASKKTQSKTLSTPRGRPSAATKAKILAEGMVTRRRLAKEKETKRPRGRPRKNTTEPRGSRSSLAARASARKTG